MTHGIVVVDKPAGVSSARALSAVKARFPKKTKVGHAGTLDPFATGVLLALIGDGTRLSRWAMALPKTYRAVVRFGRETTTLDPDGEVVAEADPGPAPPDGLAAAMAAHEGAVAQVPPAFSALKVDGRRAYKLARAGEAPALAPRTVHIHGIDRVRTDWPEVELEVRCGAGTYVRALARDLGAAVGLPASLTALRRTAIGPYAADAADGVRPLLGLLAAAGLAEVALPPAEALALAAGRPVTHAAEGEVAVTCAGRLVGVAKGGRGALAAVTVLAHARRALEEGTLSA